MSALGAASGWLWHWRHPLSTRIGCASATLGPVLLPHPNQLGFLRGIAEIVDNVRLPICGTIAEIGRVQRRFLVGVVRIGLTDLFKGGG